MCMRQCDGIVTSSAPCMRPVHIGGTCAWCAWTHSMAMACAGTHLLAHRGHSRTMSAMATACVAIQKAAATAAAAAATMRGCSAVGCCIRPPA